MTIVRFDEKKGFYVADDNGWKYLPGHNWTCGKTDHTRKDHRYLSAEHEKDVAEGKAAQSINSTNEEKLEIVDSPTEAEVRIY